MRRSAVVLAGVTAACLAAAAPAATQVSVERSIEAAKTAMATAPDEALRRAQLVEREARMLPPGASRQRAEATALWLQGEAMGRLEEFDRAAPVVAHARETARRVAPGSKLEGDILLTQGNNMGEQARVTEALEAFVAAHRIFLRIGEPRSQAISLVSIATLYKSAKDYDAALRYLAEALDAYDDDPAMAVSIYNNRGVILNDQGQFAKADAAFGQALRIARSIHNAAMSAQILRNAARNQLKAGRLAAADRSIATGRALSRGGDGDETAFYAVAAEAALQHGRPAEAAALIERTFAGVDLATTALTYRDAHETAYNVYRALHQPGRALVHLTALKRLDDDATKLATQTSTALMAARFNSANQDARIARLKLDEAQRAVAFEQQRAQAERTLFLGGAGATALVIILLLVGLFTIRRSRDEVRAANDDLAVTNDALGKALAAKTEFLATTSHEIRTPLNGILGMTEVMLADRQLAPPTRERLTVVHGAGLTMRALVDDILDVAKMETGNLSVEAAPFALRQTLCQAVMMWRDQARAKGLSFVADLDACPERVVGDAARIRQIAFNLLSNALKFTAEGGVTLAAAATDTGVTITVADTGIGIPTDKQEEVFESFRQADTSTTRQFGGTGLGLSICRNLARAMGGEVTLASTPGVGSTFTVTLPLECPACPEEAPAADGRGALLLVDRNPISRAMLRNLLAPHAGAISAAASLDEALAGVTTAAPSAILVDDAAARAEGDPHAFLAAVRAAAPCVPVTLLWPATTEAERAALCAAGADRIVTKPVTGAALVATLFPVADTLVSHAA